MAYLCFNNFLVSLLCIFLVQLLQALITQKTAEALFGFRLLSENILRALIVVCDDGTIRKIKPIVPDSNNISKL